jgi:[ribosomal protein S5]-alanine N-acetyltransferase
MLRNSRDVDHVERSYGSLLRRDRIETERLTLRPPAMADAPAIFDGYARDPEVVRYLTWSAHESIERTHTFLRRCDARRRSGEAFSWALTLKGEDHPIGMLELRPTGYKADVGFVLARSYWNRGYMTEALRAVVARALAQPELYRVWAICDVENSASARVLEKAGFRREGTLRRWMVNPNVSAEPRDCLCYAVVK